MGKYYNRYLSMRARQNGINWIREPQVPQNLSLLDKEAEAYLREVRREERLRYHTPIIPGDMTAREERVYVPQQRRWMPTLGWACLGVSAMVVAYALGSAVVVGDGRDVLLAVAVLAILLGAVCLHRE